MASCLKPPRAHWKYYFCRSNRKNRQVFSQSQLTHQDQGEEEVFRRPFEITNCWKAGGQLPQQPQNDYDLLDLVKCIQNFRPELPHCSRPIITEQVNYTGTKIQKRKSQVKSIGGLKIYESLFLNQRYHCESIDICFVL